MINSITISLLILFHCLLLKDVFAHDLNVNLLTNPGFEDALANNPPSGWVRDWTPIESGVVRSSNALHSGTNGLWGYTVDTDVDAFVKLSQDFSAQPGDVYSGMAWLRTPASGGSWDSGSIAWLRVEFFDVNGRLLDGDDSEMFTAETNGVWTNFCDAYTEAAPYGTVRVQYSIKLERPGDGLGHAIINIDDCSFELVAQNQLSDQLPLQNSPLAVSIARHETGVSFMLKNQSAEAQDWVATSSANWISSITPASGTLFSGGSEEIVILVDRAGLSEESYTGLIQITYAGGVLSTLEKVYMDMDAGYSTIPTLPSVMTIDGYRLLVQKRLPGNTLDTVKPWVIKGAAWSPASIWMSGDKVIRRMAFQEWYLVDIGMLQEMNANTVYTFLDFGINGDGMAILDALYKKGIMAVITVDNNGEDDHSNIRSVVNAYKNHPAVLMWAIGNEWNLNYYHGKYGDPYNPTTASLQAAAEANENAAQLIKSLDTVHPVASIIGEIEIDGRQPLLPQSDLLSTSQIVNDLCPSVDIWGGNIYRGQSFGTLFDDWKSISSKPFFLSEFGSDSYYTLTKQPPITGYLDERAQSYYLNSQWIDLSNEISAYDPSEVCLGGTAFEWNDEWWKVPAPDGSTDKQDNGGFSTDSYNPLAHKDGFANEEYFGLVDINRRAKEGYYVLQDYYAAPEPNFVPIALIPDKTVQKGTPFPPLSLDDYGSDVEDSDADLQWSFSGNSELLVSIDGNRVATITIPWHDWVGSETITFRVEDSGGLFDEDQSTYTVEAPENSIVPVLMLLLH